MRPALGDAAGAYWPPSGFEVGRGAVRRFRRTIHGLWLGQAPYLLAAVTALPYSAPAIACAGDCDGNGRIRIDEIMSAVAEALDRIPPSPCAAADANRDGQVAIDDLVRAVQNLLAGCPSTPTPSAGQFPTATPSLVPPATETPSATAAATETETPEPEATATATPSPSEEAPTATPTDAVATPTKTPTPSDTVATPTTTATPTGGSLGTRRFSIEPNTSLFLAVYGNNLVTGGIVGFRGHLDLRGGVPDPVTGQASIDVIGASEFISADLSSGTLCIRPLVNEPVLAAGLIDCEGGAELGIDVSQDHSIGVVGAGGFSAEECAAAGGTVEPAELPHPAVCNGPVVVGRLVGVDSGAGAVVIGPDAALGTQGLPAELSFLPPGMRCEDGPPGAVQRLALISGASRTRIFDRDNVAGQTLSYDDPGENFSCAAWTQEDGPGKLVLAIPTLHGIFVGGSVLDVINVFLLDD